MGGGSVVLRPGLINYVKKWDCQKELTLNGWGAIG